MAYTCIHVQGVHRTPCARRANNNDINGNNLSMVQYFMRMLMESDKKSRPAAGAESNMEPQPPSAPSGAAQPHSMAPQNGSRRGAPSSSQQFGHASSWRRPFGVRNRGVPWAPLGTLSWEVRRVLRAFFGFPGSRTVHPEDPRVRRGFPQTFKIIGMALGAQV